MLERLHSDQERQFESNVMLEMCKQFHINKTRTTPYHPQSDGLVERFNRTLISMLATMVHENPGDWDRHLKLFISDIWPPREGLPVDLAYGSSFSYGGVDKAGVLSEVTEDLLRSILGIQEATWCHHGEAKELYDRKVHRQEFEVSNLVIKKGAGCTVHGLGPIRNCQQWHTGSKILGRAEAANS